MLYDQYGQPIDRSRLMREEAAPTVTGVRQILSDHPAQGLTPRRLAQILLAAEQGDPVSFFELAEEMEEKDLHYRAVLGTRRLQVSQLPITVEAVGDDRASQQAAELVREALVETGVVSDYLFDLMDAVGKGYSVGEILWQTTASRWTPARIDWRDPRWFCLDRTDGRTLLLRGGVEGIGPPEPLKPFGYVTHVHKTKSGIPVRGGVARAVAWLYLFKNFDLKAWVEFLETFGQPIRLGKYGQGASADEKATLLRAVRSLAKDAAAIIPQSMQVDLIEAKVNGTVTVQQAFADWVDRQVSKAVLGQTGTTDTGQYVGTATAHDKVKDDIERDDARQVANTINDCLVRPLIDLNLGPQTRYPRLVIARPDAIDTKLFMETVKTFVELGGDIEQSVVRDKLGLPDPPPGADVKLLRPATGPRQTPEAAAPALTIASQAPAHSVPVQGEDAIDHLVTEMLGDWQPLIDPVVDPIRALLAECSDLDEFQRRLPELAQSEDPTALVEQLARAIFASRLSGETADG